MKLEKFYMIVDKRMCDYPNERKGQAMYNALWFDLGRDDLADLIVGTENDPFHMDSRIDNFIHFLVTKGFLSR